MRAAEAEADGAEAATPPPKPKKARQPSAVNRDDDIVDG